MVRMRAAFTAALADVWAAVTAIQFHSFLNDMHLQPGGPSGFVGDFQSLQALPAVGALYTAVALIYRHLHQAEADGRLSDFVTFVLVAAAGLLLQHAGGADDDVFEAARKLGLAALCALPAAATRWCASTPAP
ncbi:hypothetical protein BS78_10G078600 [Paspalum vaginatum]|nr:hypothetical protein BS78_10G078600 [Paspalum vaginatum]